MKKIVFYTLIIFLSGSCGQTNQKIDYLITFAKASGYVKYFHPSDEAYDIDWNQFASYGADEIIKCKNKNDLIETFNALFKPIAPSVKFIHEGDVTEFDIEQIKPENSEHYCFTYWQHQGVGFNMELHPSSPYKSERATSNCGSNDVRLFDFDPNIEEVFAKNIGSGIYCQIPTVLYKDEENTFPKADSESLNDLRSNILQSGDGPDSLSARLGNIINTYCVFQHFYPYFDVVEVNWEQETREALKRSFSDKNSSDHLITLEKLTAPLMDGHIAVYGPQDNSFTPKLMWEWIENELVITNVLDQEINLQIGDVVTEINGMSAHKYFDEVKSRISAATQGRLNYIAEVNSLLGPESTVIEISVNGKKAELKRNIHYYSSINLFKNNQKEFEKLDDSTLYLNLDVISMDKIYEIFSLLEASDTIICDVRGYPNSNHELITHLLDSDDTAQGWMQVPLIVHPDREKIVGFNKYDWRDGMKVKEPSLVNKNVIFIIDGRAISYAETFLGYIEGYKLATIIGQPSAGTNGNTNHFKLIGNFGIQFTGMKVLKHDGSQHHGIGILPDVYVEKTIKGVKEGRDEFLEKAIQIAMNE